MSCILYLLCLSSGPNTVGRPVALRSPGAAMVQPRHRQRRQSGPQPPPSGHRQPWPRLPLARMPSAAQEEGVLEVRVSVPVPELITGAARGALSSGSRRQGAGAGDVGTGHGSWPGSSSCCAHSSLHPAHPGDAKCDPGPLWCQMRQWKHSLINLIPASASSLFS